MPETTYAEFTDSAYYTANLAGAQLTVRMICDDDPALDFVGLGDFSPSAEVEKLPIEEGGNAGPSEIVTGRIDHRFSGSIFITSEVLDGFVPTQSTFLDRRRWTVLVFDGTEWPEGRNAKGGARVRYCLLEAHFSSVSIQHAARGDVRGSFQGLCKRMQNGEEYATKNGV